MRFLNFLGGQWIGPAQKRINRMVNMLGIETVKQHMNGKSVLLSNGTSKSYSGIIPPLGVLGLIDLQLALWDCDNKAATVPVDKPWTCPNAVEWDSMTVHTYMKSKLWTQDAMNTYVVI